MFDRVRSIEQVLSTLEKAFESLLKSVLPNTTVVQGYAKERLRSILTAVRGGADISSFGSEIESVTDILENNNTALYRTRADFLRSQYETIYLLEELKKESGNQLTVAEQQLQAIKNGFEQELQRLDGILQNATNQLNAILGVDNSVKSVEVAVRELDSAIRQLADAQQAAAAAARQAAMASYSTGASSTSFGSPSTTPPVESLNSPYEAMLAGYITSSVNEYGSFTGIGDSGYRLVDNGTSATLYFPGGGSHQVQGSDAASTLISTYGLISGGLNGTLIRTRASGGYTPPGLTLVGEEGPELINFAKPGMVYNAAQTQQILSSSSSSLEDKFELLRKEVSALRAETRAVVMNTSKTARILDDVSEGGTSLNVKTV